MMNKKQTTRISKFLSLVLRHQPETIGLRLDDGGWADVGELLEAMARHGHGISLDELRHVVATNSKKRFAFNADESRIRASQGHSIGVDLGLTPVEPPAGLYHGTAERNLDAILREGLKRQARDHVHLSPDEETARQVGQRHGSPVVLRVDAARMRADGRMFYQSENGVWLTDSVPPQYLQAIKEVPR